VAALALDGLRCASTGLSVESRRDDWMAVAETFEFLTVTTEDDGAVIYALTREGKAIGRQLAMTQGEDARLAMLNELLDASPDT
jgi:hypothetical protein